MDVALLLMVLGVMLSGFWAADGSVFSFALPQSEVNIHE